MIQRLLSTLLALVLVAHASTAQALFLSPDTEDPTLPGVGTNRYAYSLGDPVNRMDPSGNEAVPPNSSYNIGQGLGNFFRSLFAGPGGSNSDANANLAAMPSGMAQAVSNHPYVEAAGFGVGLTPVGDVWGTGKAAADGDAVGVILGVAGSAPGAGDALGWMGRLIRRSDLPTEAVTGTVWDTIKATDSVWEGTVVPRSFEMTTANGSIWVHPNATEHIAEFNSSVVLRDEIRAVTAQGQLTDLHGAVTAATANGITYGQMINQNGWELIFSPPGQTGPLPALTHARLLR